MLEQTSLFVDDRTVAIQKVAKTILRSDSTRSLIKKAILSGDKTEAIRLINTSISTFGFSYAGFSWILGKIETADAVYKPTPTEIYNEMVGVILDEKGRLDD